MVVHPGSIRKFCTGNISTECKITTWWFVTIFLNCQIDGVNKEQLELGVLGFGFDTHNNRILQNKQNKSVHL